MLYTLPEPCYRPDYIPRNHRSSFVTQLCPPCSQMPCDPIFGTRCSPRTLICWPPHSCTPGTTIRLYFGNREPSSTLYIDRHRTFSDCRTSRTENASQSSNTCTSGSATPNRKCSCYSNRKCPSSSEVRVSEALVEGFS